MTAAVHPSEQFAIGNRFGLVEIIGGPKLRPTNHGKQGGWRETQYLARCTACGNTKWHRPGNLLRYRWNCTCWRSATRQLHLQSEPNEVHNSPWCRPFCKLVHRDGVTKCHKGLHPVTEDTVGLHRQRASDGTYYLYYKCLLCRRVYKRTRRAEQKKITIIHSEVPNDTSELPRLNPRYKTQRVKKPPIICTNCTKLRPHAARGLCEPCYQHQLYLERPLRLCPRCNRWRKPGARGLCSSCYSGDHRREKREQERAELAEISCPLRYCRNCRRPQPLSAYPDRPPDLRGRVRYRVLCITCDPPPVALTQLVCGHCERVFMPIRYNQKWCSPTCRSANYEARQRSRLTES